MLPECDDDTQLSEKFSEFFSDKVKNIRSSIKKSSFELSCGTSKLNSSYFLDSLTQVTQDEIKAIVTTSSNKHSQLDPIPTWVLKLSIKPLIPLITTLVNKSFENAVVPKLLKTAYIKP